MGTIDRCDLVSTAVWCCLLVGAWALTVAALIMPSWVEGEFELPGGVTLEREVGLFKQCVSTEDDLGEIESCFDMDPLDGNNKFWVASGLLFIIGAILLGLDVFLAIVSMFHDRFVRTAKTFMAMTLALYMVAILLLTAGFAFLDDSCPISEPGEFRNEGQCGFSCLPGDKMDYFQLCSPYEAGEALWLIVAAIASLFVAAAVGTCVRSSHRKEEPEVPAAQAVATTDV